MRVRASNNIRGSWADICTFILLTEKVLKRVYQGLYLFKSNVKNEKNPRLRQRSSRLDVIQALERRSERSWNHQGEEDEEQQQTTGKLENRTSRSACKKKIQNAQH